MKKYHGFVNIENSINYLIKPLLSKRKDNFIIISNLKNAWPNIVGEKFYQFCEPYKIKFEKGKKSCGTLYIKSFNSSIAFYLESAANEIIEKIAAYYGYKIVEKIRINQELRNIISEQNNQIKRNLSEDSQKIINNHLSNINDTELKSTLLKLGEIIFDKK